MCRRIRFSPLPWVIAVLATSGCSKPDAPSSAPAPPGARPSTPAKPPDVAKDAPKFSLTADDFVAEYKKDRDKFKGPTPAIPILVEVSGVVRDLDETSTGTNLFLEAKGGSFGMISCTCDDRHLWGKVVPGQQVKLKGKCYGDASQAALADCLFVDLGKNPAITLSSEDLAAEYARDPAATEDKYKNKYMIVTGEIVEKDKEDPPKIALKGSGAAQVALGFGTVERKAYEPMKVGDKVKVVGRFEVKDKGVYLRQCHLATEGK